MARIRKFLLLPGRERLLLVQATFLLVVIRLGLSLVLFRTLRRLLVRFARADKTSKAPRQSDIDRVIWALKAAGRTPETTKARLRYTAPFDMSGHPTLTLPGGITTDGVPVGFQIVGRAFDEAPILAAGHAFQQVTDWHTRRPPV